MAQPVAPRRQTSILDRTRRNAAIRRKSDQTSQRPRSARAQDVLTRSRYRRTSLHTRYNRPTIGRLPRPVVSTLSDHAQSKVTKRPLRCMEKKQQKRAVIINTGYGGRNNFKNYREHTKCY